jgi:hypothetical protein
MPVSVEQVAFVVRRMSPEERRRLVELAPELREVLRPARTLAQARESAQALREEVQEGLGGELPGADEVFLGELTLGKYLDLPDEERARLWEMWAEEDWEAGEEVDVCPDAVPPG